MATPLDFQAGLTVGTVESVAPDSIEVLLLPEAPHGTALNSRTLTRFPRLNGVVAIPSEVGAIIGMVAWLGVEKDRRSFSAGPADLVDVALPRRRMRVIPLGTAVTGDRGPEIRRGVLMFPTVGDPVQIPTAEVLAGLTRHKEVGSISIGQAPLAGGSEVYVDIDALFGSHFAVLGSTGSGKSCSIASLIRSSISEARSVTGTARPRVVVLDLNGEYAEAFDDLGVPVRKLSVEPDGDAERFRLPGWLWNAREWICFAGARPGAQAPYVRRALAQLRSSAGIAEPVARRAATTVRTLEAEVKARTYRAPALDFRVRMDDGRLIEVIIASAEELIPDADADLKQLLQAVESHASGMRSASFDGRAWNSITQGGWEALGKVMTDVLVHFAAQSGPSVHEDDPLPFDMSMVVPMIQLMTSEDGSGGAASWIAPLVFRLENLLADRRLALIAEACDEIQSVEQWLDGLLGPAGAGQITVIDLSLVPVKALHLVVGVLGRLIFEAHERFRRTNQRPLPTIIVAEEAHLFLGRRGPRSLDDGPEPAAELCRDSFDRIAREGRKFGLSVVVASQRPSELSETVLSQCNNFLVHRIVNEADQDLVRRLVPDSLGGLLREIPSLPSGAAILMGTAPVIPTLVQMHPLDGAYRPNSSTPSFFQAWHDDSEQSPGWSAVSADWAVYAEADPVEEPF